MEARQRAFSPKVKADWTVRVESGRDLKKLKNQPSVFLVSFFWAMQKMKRKHEL